VRQYARQSLQLQNSVCIVCAVEPWSDRNGAPHAKFTSLDVAIDSCELRPHALGIMGNSKRQWGVKEHMHMGANATAIPWRVAEWSEAEWVGGCGRAAPLKLPQ
jgi:hypothetical protein